MYFMQPLDIIKLSELNKENIFRPICISQKKQNEIIYFFVASFYSKCFKIPFVTSHWVQKRYMVDFTRGHCEFL